MAPPATGSRRSRARSRSRFVPAAGRDLEADVRRPPTLARGYSGHRRSSRLHAKKNRQACCEPWLGIGFALDELPVPRLIVVKLAAGATPILRRLRNTLVEQVPGATLDDHRSFVARMRAMADSGCPLRHLHLAAGGRCHAAFGVLCDPGRHGGKPFGIEVLHFIGAKNGFIAGHFQRRFLLLGLKGGAIGGGGALAVFALAALASRWFPGSAAADQLGALFGRFFDRARRAIWPMLGQIVLIAGATAISSRMTVNWTLETIR